MNADQTETKSTEYPEWFGNLMAPYLRRSNGKPLTKAQRRLAHEARVAKFKEQAEYARYQRGLWSINGVTDKSAEECKNWTIYCYHMEHEITMAEAEFAAQELKIALSK